MRSLQAIGTPISPYSDWLIMQKRIYPGILVALLIVLIGGTFVGLSAAHGESSGRAEGTCEMTHANEECEVSHGRADCLMMDSGMMGMGDDCPVEQRGEMMRMHGDESSGHHDCPTH